MRPRVLRIREYASTSSVANAGVALLLLASSLAICAQSTASSAQNPAEQAEPAASAQVTQTHLAAAPETRGIAITQDELRQQLAGKTFYLRGGYLDNSLHFSENGQLVSSSPQASYTLSLVEIEKVHLDKHKVELEAVRYGLHFLGALPSEDPTQAADKVRLTPKKKLLKITIDREELVAPKKQKAAKRKGGLPRAASSSQQTQGVGEPQAAAANDSERPVGRHGVTTTTSAAHANQLLKGALDKIFAPGIDDRMISALPDYWKLYYLQRRPNRTIGLATLQCCVRMRWTRKQKFWPPSTRHPTNMHRRTAWPESPCITWWCRPRASRKRSRWAAPSDLAWMKMPSRPFARRRFSLR